MRVGFTHDELATQAVRSLCQEMLTRWIGKPKPPEASKTNSTRATSLLPVRQTQAGSECRVKDAFIELQAQNEARTLGLQAETLLNQLMDLAGSHLGKNTDRFFQDLLQGVIHDTKGGSPVAPPWLQASTELFGTRTSESVAPGQSVAMPALVQATEAAIKEQIQTAGDAIKQWLLHWLEDPQHRLYAAQKSLAWFQGYFRTLLDQFREIRRRFAAETGSLEQYLVSLPTDWKKAQRPARKVQGPEPEAAFLQFCRLRLQDFAAVLAGKVVQSLQSVLSGTGDLLVDLNRELHVLVGQYDDGGDVQPKAAPALFGQLRQIG